MKSSKGLTKILRDKQKEIEAETLNLRKEILNKIDYADNTQKLIGDIFSQNESLMADNAKNLCATNLFAKKIFPDGYEPKYLSEVEFKTLIRYYGE